MRPVLHGDVVAAARALLCLPEAARSSFLQRLFRQANWADAYRKKRGQVHPFWGDGSLEVVAAGYEQRPEPYLHSPEYCKCMISVFEGLLAESGITSPSRR